MSYSAGIYQEEFIRYDKQNISGDIIIRIITTNKILFLYQSQFKNTIEELDKIKHGEMINVGVKKLENSGYWVYFLKTEKSELITDNIYQEQKKTIKSFKYSFISLLFFTALLFYNTEFTPVLFLISLIMTVISFYDVYIYLTSPINDFIENPEKKEDIKNYKKNAIKIFLVLNKNLNRFTARALNHLKEKIMINKSYKCSYDEDKSIISKHDIIVKYNNIDNIENTYDLSFNNPGEKIKTAKNNYIFGNKENIFTCTTHNKKTDFGYLTIKKHPFFLGIDDRIEVYCDLNKNEAIGVYNHTTQSAYLFLPYGYFNYREKSILFRFLLPIMILFYILVLFSPLLFLSFLFFGSLTFLFKTLIVTTIFSILVTVITLMIFYLKNRKYIHRKKADKYAIVKKHLLSKLKKKENLLIINSINLFK